MMEQMPDLPGESHKQSTSTFEQLAENLRSLTDRLTRHGLRMSVSGRFAEYERCIDRALSFSEGHVAVSDEDLVVLHRAMIETYELGLIVEELGGRPGVAGWKEKTQDVLGGRAVGGGANRHDLARDIQFELYIAALTRRAGFQVHLGEPDVLCFDEELGDLALAAKRIQSKRKIRKRIKEANKQLRDSGIPGFVAVDLTWAVPEFNAIRRGASNDSIGAALNADVRSYVEDNALMLLKEIDTRWTYALLVHVAAPCVVAKGPRLGNNRVLRLLNFCNPQSREEAMVLSFKNKLKWITQLIGE